MPPEPRVYWWSDRWAWRGAIAAAPLGALAAILHSLLVERASVETALTSYVIGAAVAAGLGCLLAGPLGGTAETVAERRAHRQWPAEQAHPDEPYPDDPHAEVPAQPGRQAAAGDTARMRTRSG